MTMWKLTEALFEHCQLLKVYRGQDLCAIYTLLDKELFLVGNISHLFLKYIKKW